MDGILTQHLEQSTSRLSAGDVILMNTQIRHKEGLDTHCSCIYLQLSPAFLQKLLYTNPIYSEEQQHQSLLFRQFCPPSSDSQQAFTGMALEFRRTLRSRSLTEDPEILPAHRLLDAIAMEITQGKLCMGFVSPITNRTADFPAMQLLNTIFGSGMTSKLFMNIREKMSLCYSIGSGYYGTKGIVTVSAGIDFDKEELTRQEVLRQLKACQDGDISEEELTAARQAILSSLRATHDSPSAIEGYYATAALSGMGLTPAEYMAAVVTVTKEQVVAAARSLTLHSTYFLKGECQ
jgi:hypothetical protein